MRLAFLGTGDFACPPLRALVHAGHALEITISQPDKPAGRGLEIQPTPVHKLASDLNLPHVQATDVNAPEILTRLAGCELGIVVAFGQKLGPDLLRALPQGCINIHASLLPRYRGAAPFQRAVINGDPTTGVTIFQLNEKWDAGSIWARSETAIGETETASELHDRLALVGADLAVQTLDDLQHGRIQPITQDPTQATRAPKLSRAESNIDWNRPARAVACSINGLWSWPTATCTFISAAGKSERVQLARARTADSAAAPQPGLPPGAFRPDGAVQANPGSVQILEIKPAGGKHMPFDAFTRSRDIRPPARLLPIEVPA